MKYVKTFESYHAAAGAKFNVSAGVRKLQDIFTDAGAKLYIVGGAVRDFVLGKTPKDIDLVTDLHPDKIIELLEPHGFKLILTGKAFGIVNVIVDGEEFEVATFRADDTGGRRPDSVTFTDLDTDAQRRDLTMNALYYDLETGEIIDKVGGLDDIKNKVVRTVGHPDDRFGEDALRRLRAVRFTARFDSDMAEEVKASLRRSNSLSEVSQERVVAELEAGVKNAARVSRYFGLLEEYGFFPLIFPDLTASTKIVTDHKDFEIAIASVLHGNVGTSLAKPLIELKYSTEQSREIDFFVEFQTLGSDIAYTMRKQADVYRIAPERLKIAGEVFEMDARLIDAFTRYKITTKGQDLLARGLKGKEVGDEMERIENAKFRELVG